MFIAFVKKFCIFSDVELVSSCLGPKSCNFDINKNSFKWANVSVFSFKRHINNIIHPVHMNLFNLDQFIMGQLY